MLSNSLGRVSVLFLHNGGDLGQRNKGKKLQIALYCVVRGANKELAPELD
jgi:hypothetical protein